MIERRRLQFWKLSRSGPYPWLLALAVILLVVQSVRLFYTLVTPPGPIGDWRPTMAQPIAYSERLALLSAFDPFFRQDIVAKVDNVERITSLDVTLYGVTMNRATGGGSAIIAGPDKIQNSILIGEEILPGVRLVGLAFDHVRIENKGVEELLYLDQSIEATPASPVPAVPSEAPGQIPPPAPGGQTLPVNQNAPNPSQTNVPGPSESNISVNRPSDTGNR